MKKKVFFIVSVLVLIAAISIAAVFDKQVSVCQKNFSYSEDALGNPLIGYAPSALESELSDDIHLVYVDITWKELESEKNVYNWDAIEEENQFKRWREEGKHLVLRFLMDYPRKDRHMDIPQWLYDELSDPGDWYDSSYGKGFSPNYGDEKLLSYYQKAVKAMGEHWGDDTLISYIELGGLGHWGEWHINREAGIRQLPNEKTREQYVTPWVQAFPKADLLMRRPFATAEKYGLGIYNDMAGDLESTNEWLDWIEAGGVYSQTEEKSLVAMPEAWKKSPIGGELTSGTSMTDLMVTDLEQTIDLIRKSHTTFLGPKIAEAVDGDQTGYNSVLQNMGYRLWISEAKLEQNDGKTKLSMVWQNSGVAPFYKNWKVYAYVEDGSGNEVEKVEVPINLTTILPGDQVGVFVNLTTKDIMEAANNGYRISIGIVDPMTNSDAVHFAVVGQEAQKRLILFP